MARDAVADAAESGAVVLYWHTRTDGRREWETVHGQAYRYVQPTTGIHGVAIYGTDQLRHCTRSVYVIDDGRTAVAHYVAGWSGNGGAEERLLLHPFPVTDGKARRPDNGRVVDYGTWKLPPLRCYHVKITE